MPFGTITATESTFGSISGSIVGAVPGTLSGSVGVPGPQGPAGSPGSPGSVGPQGPVGPAGQGVPAGGLTNQFLVKASNLDYATAWTTFSLAGYATESWVTSQGYLTASALTGYATQSFVAANYAPIAAGLPTGGTVGQVLTKQSGTDFDASFQTLIPGDRYLTTSTTSNTIGNGAKTFTVGTGLSYSIQQDVVISYDASNHMHALVTSYNSGTGVLVVDVNHHTGSGTYTAWTVNVGGTTPLQSVEWGEILGTIGDQSDLATALGNKLESSTAASTYAALAGATFTGEVITPASTTSNAGLTITPGVAPTTPTDGEIWATTNDLQVRLNGVTETIAEQSWVTAGFYPLSGNPSGFLVSSALTPYALLSGATFTGLISTPAATTASAFLRLPHGTAPTTPTNGDVWTTTTALQVRINGSTQNIPSTGGSNTFSGQNTFSGATVSFGTSTAASTINVGTGATLTATTKAVNIGTNGVAGSTTNIAIGSATSTTTTTVEGTVTLNGTTLNLGTSTATSTYNIGNGATLSGSTKTINIGTNGVLGSTNVINIGPTATSGNINFNNNSVALGSNSTATTATADTNSTVVATTAYVVGQAGSATPLVNGTAAVGTSLRYARQDHVHGTDTTRAPLASPTFTGTPLSTTAAVDTNTTQIATTAFVVAQAAAATPLVNGTAAVGTSLRYARADHVHPTDATRAPLASPAFTGTPSLPTGTTAVTQTAGNNTTAVATTAFVQQEVPAASTTAAGKIEIATNAEVITGSASTLALTPANSPFAFCNGMLQRVDYANNTAISGSGTVTSYAGFRESYTNATAVAGRAAFYLGGVGAISYTVFGSNAHEARIDFSKKIWMSGRAAIGVNATYIGDANCTALVTLGGYNNFATGNMTLRGIGFRKVGGTSSFVELIVHNGTTFTAVATTKTCAIREQFEYIIYSDGTGNVTLYINGSQAATTTAGPTSATGDFEGVYREQVEQTASATVRYSMHNYGGTLFADR